MDLGGHFLYGVVYGVGLWGCADQATSITGSRRNAVIDTLIAMIVPLALKLGFDGARSTWPYAQRLYDKV